MRNSDIRCGFIASYFGPYYSNFVASMISFEIKMREKGYISIYILPKAVEQCEWKSQLAKMNMTVYFIDYKPYSLRNIIDIREIIKKHAINILYSHFCGWDFTAHFAAPHCPIIWHMRMAVNLSSRKKRIKNWIKFRVIGFGNTYHIAISRPSTDSINALNPHHKCIMINDAFDFSRLSCSHSRFPSDSQVKILIFGWEPIVKGLDTALSACEIINTEDVIVRLRISSQEKTYKYLNARYGNIPEWIEVLEPTDNIAEIYETSDIMLSASRSEGFSNALAEALYSGLPAVISDISGTNWAHEFRCVYTFSTGNENDLAKAINTCITKGISEEDRMYNKRLIEDKYSMDEWTANVVQFIEKIMKHSKKEELPND